MQYQVAIAGSTQFSQQAAQLLTQHENFHIAATLTPPPHKIGRKQQLMKNPLHRWAEVQQCPIFFVDKKIQKEVFHDFQQQLPPIDFLVVLDFGYFIPSWLLALPRIAPINIHPSLLPAWRGSSPGQFALLLQYFTGLYQGQPLGGSQSGVTIMMMNSRMDQGDILLQLPFQIQAEWTQKEYYQFAFDLALPRLAEVLQGLSQGVISGEIQPLSSSTPVARKLEKGDGFIQWPTLSALLLAPPSLKSSSLPNELHDLSFFGQPSLLQNLLSNADFCPDIMSQRNFLQAALAAFTPWPGVWTLLPTTQGAKRLKILSLKKQQSNWQLDQVQVEGKNPSRFSDLKSLLPS